MAVPRGICRCANRKHNDIRLAFDGVLGEIRLKLEADGDGDIDVFTTLDVMAHPSHSQ